MRDREMKAKVAGVEVRCLIKSRLNAVSVQILMHVKDNDTDVSITVNIYDMGAYRLLDFRCVP